MRSNPNNLSWLIWFLDYNIKASLSVPPSDTFAIQNACPTKFTPFSTIFNIDAFYATLDTDFNKIASKAQMHSTFHNAFCYKYGKNGSTYHFNFSRPLVEETYVDKCNSLHFKQNNV